MSPSPPSRSTAPTPRGRRKGRPATRRGPAPAAAPSQARTYIRKDPSVKSEPKRLRAASDVPQRPGPERPSRTEAEEAVRTLLRWIGEDASREGLLGTPDRVVRAY